MRLCDLNEDQKHELKQAFLTRRMDEHGESPSYGELASAGSLVDDADLEKEYGDTEFVPEDFVCSAPGSVRSYRAEIRVPAGQAAKLGALLAGDASVEDLGIETGANGLVYLRSAPFDDGYEADFRVVEDGAGGAFAEVFLYDRKGRELAVFVPEAPDGPYGVLQAWTTDVEFRDGSREEYRLEIVEGPDDPDDQNGAGGLP